MQSGFWCGVGKFILEKRLALLLISDLDLSSHIGSRSRLHSVISYQWSLLVFIQVWKLEWAKCLMFCQIFSDKAHVLNSWILCWSSCQRHKCHKRRVNARTFAMEPKKWWNNVGHAAHWWGVYATKWQSLAYVNGSLKYCQNWWSPQTRVQGDSSVQANILRETR